MRGEGLNTYCVKISEEVKNMLLKYSSDRFVYPNLFEEIEFFKGDYCWLETSTRAADICMIYPNNEKEIEYLKEIGLKFKL